MVTFSRGISLAMVCSKGMFFCSGATGKFTIVGLLSMVASVTVIKEFVNYTALAHDGKAMRIIG